jgi:hypothetical protein
MAPIRILSLWEPWASFMALGYKRNETRHWQTPYRGLLAIHAAKTTRALKEADEILEDAGFDMSVRAVIGGTKWPLGDIVAVVTLVDCVPTEKIRDSLTQCELEMGNYSDERYAWVTQNLRRLYPGIPFRGLQGLKPLSTEGRAAVAARLPELRLTT